MGFLRKGKEAAKEVQASIEKDKVRKERFENEVRRFWLNKGTEAQVTFLDGDLMSDGQLNMTTFYQHSVKVDGKWQDFVCTAHEDTSQPCPICEGDNYAAMVGAFTVVDHSSYVDKKGKEYTNQVKLFIAKKYTLQRLQKLAMKREGLAGCTFEVSRSELETAPNVGDAFDFVKKKPIKKVLKQWDAEPIEYEKAITYFTPEELRAQGFGLTGATADDKPKKKKLVKKKKVKAKKRKNDKRENWQETKGQEQEGINR